MSLKKNSSFKTDGNGADWQMECDWCGHTNDSGTHSPDPGETAENARKRGWKTMQSALGDPLRWICPKCVQTKIGKS